MSHRSVQSGSVGRPPPDAGFDVSQELYRAEVVARGTHLPRALHAQTPSDFFHVELLLHFYSAPKSRMAKVLVADQRGPATQPQGVTAAHCVRVNVDDHDYLALWVAGMRYPHAG